MLRNDGKFWEVRWSPGSTRGAGEMHYVFDLSAPAGEQVVAECPGSDGGDHARLIAAAPALLAALLDMLDCLETEIECGDAFPYTAKIERAWESVRQARGEEAS